MARSKELRCRSLTAEAADRRSCSEGSRATGGGPLIGQLRKGLPEGEYRGPEDVLSAPRRGRYPTAGVCSVRLELSTGELLRTP
jgi:hypothetical protein